MAPNTKNKTEEAPKPVVEAVKPETELYPVKLLKNYRPSTEFKILEQDNPEDEMSEWTPRDPEGTVEKLEDGLIVKCAVGDYKKVWAGTVIMLPKNMARILLKERRAERHDDL